MPFHFIQSQANREIMICRKNDRLCNLADCYCQSFYDIQLTTRYLTPNISTIIFLNINEPCILPTPFIGCMCLRSF